MTTHKSVTLTPMDKKNLKKFGDRIRQIREKKQLSVYDITGEDMPVKFRQHWQLIENGQKNINLTTLYKIAKTLGVQVKDLFHEL